MGGIERAQPLSRSALFHTGHLQLRGSMNPMVWPSGSRPLLGEEFTPAEKTTSAQTVSSLPATNLKRYVGTYWSEKNGALRKFQIHDISWSWWHRE